MYPSALLAETGCGTGTEALTPMLAAIACCPTADAGKQTTVATASATTWILADMDESVIEPAVWITDTRTYVMCFLDGNQYGGYPPHREYVGVVMDAEATVRGYDYAVTRQLQWLALSLTP